MVDQLCDGPIQRILGVDEADQVAQQRVVVARIAERLLRTVDRCTDSLTTTWPLSDTLSA